MAFSVSKTIGNATYTISHDDLAGFIAALAEAEGLDGLANAAGVTAKYAGKPAPGSDASIASAVGALDDIAHPVTAEPEAHAEPADELADLIRNAPNAKTLESLWRANKAVWDGDYNKLADKRKKELEKKS